MAWEISFKINSSFSAISQPKLYKAEQVCELTEIEMCLNLPLPTNTALQQQIQPKSRSWSSQDAPWPRAGFTELLLRSRLAPWPQAPFLHAFGNT